MAVVPISYILVVLFRYHATIQSIIIIRWRDCLIHTHKHNENKCMIVYRIEMFSMSFSFCRRLRRRHSCQILKGQTLRTFSFCLYFKHELEILQTFHAILSAYITKYFLLDRWLISSSHIACVDITRIWKINHYMTSKI